MSSRGAPARGAQGKAKVLKTATGSISLYAGRPRHRGGGSNGRVAEDGSFLLRGGHDDVGHEAQDIGRPAAHGVRRPGRNDGSSCGLLPTGSPNSYSPFVGERVYLGPDATITAKRWCGVYKYGPRYQEPLLAAGVSPRAWRIAHVPRGHRMEVVGWIFAPHSSANFFFCSGEIHLPPPRRVGGPTNIHTYMYVYV